MKWIYKKYILLIYIAFIFLIGCEEKKLQEIYAKRGYLPVTILEVKKSILRKKVRLTGSVMPWKKEILRFEVAGKVDILKVVKPGKKVRGILKIIKNNKEEILYKGDVIAKLDTTPYELALKEAKSQLEASKIKYNASKKARELAEKTLEALKTKLEVLEAEIKEIIPLNIKIAEDRYNLAKKEYELTKEAYGDENTTNSRLMNAKTNMLIAETELKKAKIHKELKEKELKSYKAEIIKAEIELKLKEAEEKIAEAQVRQAETNLERAKRNLEKCELRAPFDGVISEIHINPGATVNETTPIATLVMMDPIRIDVSVSFKKLRDFYYGKEVLVYPFRESHEPEKGYIFHIYTSADPSTRTFLAIIATRNPLLDLDFKTKMIDFNKYKFITEFSGVVHKNPDKTGPLYIDVRCLLKDKKGYYVWKFIKTQSKNGIKGILKKIYVKLGDNYINVITWLFRELIDPNGLDVEDLLLVNPSSTLKENQKVIQLRQDWLFHPGELVDIEYNKDYDEGIYIPSEAIIKSTEDESYYVYIAKIDKIDEKGYKLGKAYPIKIVKRKIEELWRIESGLKEGERIIIHGCYSVDNQYEATQSPVPIRVIKEENLDELVKGIKIITK